MAKFRFWLAATLCMLFSMNAAAQDAGDIPVDAPTAELLDDENALPDEAYPVEMLGEEDAMPIPQAEIIVSLKNQFRSSVP